MTLLDIAAYRDLCAGTGAGEAVTADAAAIARVLAYARRTWRGVGLDERTLRPADVTRVVRRGEATLFHVRAYPRRSPETALVVVAGDEDGTAVAGHILIALAPDAEAPRLIAPGLDLDGVPTSAAELLLELPHLYADLRDAFAVVELADGTYMQTLAEPDGRFVLEHQLVTTACHYEVAGGVDRTTMTAAMVSYAAGDGAWIDMVRWRRQTV